MKFGYVQYNKFQDCSKTPEFLGNFTTIHDILGSKVDPISCPSGDIHNTIDNNQKVGICTCRIREVSTVHLSICTTVGHVIPQPVIF